MMRWRTLLVLADKQLEQKRCIHFSIKIFTKRCGIFQTKYLSNTITYKNFSFEFDPSTCSRQQKHSIFIISTSANQLAVFENRTIINQSNTFKNYSFHVGEIFKKLISKSIRLSFGNIPYSNILFDENRQFGEKSIYQAQ